MNNKIVLTIMIGIMFLSLLGASEASLGTVKQGHCILLKQTCSDCTYNNISAVSYPNRTENAIENVEMTQDGTLFTYSFCTTNTLGNYLVDGYGDDDGTKDVWQYNFIVTPSGNSGNSNIALFILIIFLLYGINLLGFFNENVMMTVLGGMALLFLGVYMINNGIIIYRDNLTNYVGYVTSAWGGMSSMFALYKEYFDD